MVRAHRGAPLHVASVLAVLFGCASNKTVVNSGFDFSKVRRLSVAPLEGQGGQAAADEFVRELVGKGFEVTDMRHPGDVILKGAVVDYKPNNALMVFLGHTTLVTAGGQTVVVDNPVLSLNGSRVSQEGTVVGNPNAQLTAVSSVVGMNVQLHEASSGRLLWSGSFSYEALDLQGALEAVVASLAGSLQRVMAPAPKNPS